jgi:predicted MFS family arabinose efflux permease
VPFTFFRNPNVSAANATMLGAGAAIVAVFYFVSLNMQKVIGYSAITAGISRLPLAGGVIAAAGLASPLVSRYGPRRVVIAGLAFFAAGLVWFAELPAHGTYLADLLGPSLLIAPGLGRTFVPITTLSLTDVDNRHYGLASGLVNTSQQIGGALGLAVLSTIAATRIDHLTATGHPLNQALTLGFHDAFLAAAGFVVLTAIAAATIGTRQHRKHTQPAA